MTWQISSLATLFQLQLVTLVSYWIRNLPLHRICIALAGIAITNCDNSALLRDRLRPCSAATILVHAFISSRLDYSSTLYTGLPACRLSCLERVMRSAACLIGQDTDI